MRGAKPLKGGGHEVRKMWEGGHDDGYVEVQH